MMRTLIDHVLLAVVCAYAIMWYASVCQATRSASAASIAANGSRRGWRRFAALGLSRASSLSDARCALPANPGRSDVPGINLN
jgi:hypothetical protein